MYKVVYSLSRKLKWKASEIYQFLYQSFPEIKNIDLLLDDQQFLLVVKINSRLEFSILNICQQQGLKMQFVQVEDFD
ncbi:hypothetical protein D7322_04730 [Sphingobacterium puteale]|uniref:Uncharacterized protein n=1 Tax=Sphingobacterium puteale TaxID=2420510 RepID=A0A420W2H1_9SPHI|nr:hypothetical protein [Sphingobacterium puteale]RKO72750.1 hypothetical protein D7322_04730 [Sphingobacterium puteale]